jgi:hypothetical protein
MEIQPIIHRLASDSNIGKGPPNVNSAENPSLQVTVERKVKKHAHTHALMQRIFSSSLFSHKESIEICQELGKPATDPVPRTDRPIAELDMGQGLMARLDQLCLYSKEFSSCSPVILYNEISKVGGLYHFPASALKKNLLAMTEEQVQIVKKSLSSMVERIRPTHIFVNERDPYADDVSMGYNVMRAPRGWRPDSKDLREFFEQSCSYKGVVSEVSKTGKRVADGFFWITLGDNDELLIGNGMLKAELSVAGDKTKSGRKAIQKNWQDAPGATRFGQEFTS